MMDEKTLKVMQEEGYLLWRELPDGTVAGVKGFLFTYGLMVGVTAMGYSHRYCFPDARSAQLALSDWSGDGDPDGPWIKRKGLDGEYSNPQLFKGIPIVDGADRKVGEVG